MGVGDYVHSKETRQHQPHTAEAPTQSRQALAEQARVEVPTTALVAPVPIAPNRQVPVGRYSSPFQEPPNGPVEQAVHRDVFDTDVEGIDDSTVAGTSVIGVDEIQYRLSPAISAQHRDIEQPQQPLPSPQRQFRQVRRTHDSKWYEGLGDRAMRSAGFDLDDIDNASQLTSTAGDDEQSNDTDDQRFVPRYREAEEPLSRRLQTFWSASRRSYQKHDDNTSHEEPSKGPSFIPVASTTSKPALPTSTRKVTLTRSMTTTPRTRFSPPKPSLLDQLDLTPTRRSSGTRSQLGKEDDRASDDLADLDDGQGFFAGDHDRSASFQPLTAFDITNLDNLDDDPVNDPFSRRASVRRIAPDSTRPKKRHLETDYPPEILYKKSFAELQAEPFDQVPTPIASKSATETQSTPEKGKGEDKISFLLRLSEEQRRDYFATLSIDEWEDHGDLLIDQFSKMLSKMKDLRHARRKTAAIFEAEIKRRHDLVEEQSSELSSKLEEMRTGGAEVLRGRTP